MVGLAAVKYRTSRRICIEAGVPVDEPRYPAPNAVEIGERACPGGVFQEEVGAAMKVLKPIIWSVAVLLVAVSTGRASEADLAIPDLHAGTFHIAGMAVNAWWLLFVG